MRRLLARYLRRWADHLVPPAPARVEFEAIHLPNSHLTVFRNKRTGDIEGCCGSRPRTVTLEGADGSLWTVSGAPEKPEDD
ncbi:hypothetical protein [Nocardia sp. NPDC004260]